MSDGDGTIPVPAGQGMEYDVDIVLCIDATQSMAPVIEEVKSKALQLPVDLQRAMDEKGKDVTRLRLKIIAFRDIFVDPVPFQVSEFFAMPEQRGAFEAFMSTVTASGGGDEPESGLEALGLAINSDWCNTAVKSRHLVVMWTDASAHPIEKGVGHVPAEFAGSVPTSTDELYNLWAGDQRSKMSPTARRLLLLAPGSSPWPDLEEDLGQVIHFPSKAGGGLADFEYEEILDLLVQSV